MVQSVKRIAPPEAEPIWLEDARRHLRVSGPDNDQWILDKLPRVREECEDFLERSLAPQTLAIATHWFADIALPMGPVESIVSVKYTDPDGAEITLSADVYELDTWSDPPCLRKAYGASWPSVRCTPNAVRVTYRAGFRGPKAAGAMEPVPGPVMDAMLLLLAHRYENREAIVMGVSAVELPLGVKSLLNPHRASFGI